MKLCGIGIPYNDQAMEKVAANRIHNLAVTVTDKKQLLSYDNRDIAAVLCDRNHDVAGIIRAVQEGRCFDLEGQPISRQVVTQELDTLSEDLAAIARIVTEILSSPEGKTRWSKDTIDVHQRRISLYNELNLLKENSEKLKLL